MEVSKRWVCARVVCVPQASVPRMDIGAACFVLFCSSPTVLQPGPFLTATSLTYSSSNGSASIRSTSAALANGVGLSALSLAACVLKSHDANASSAAGSTLTSAWSVATLGSIATRSRTRRGAGTPGEPRHSERSACVMGEG